MKNAEPEIEKKELELLHNIFIGVTRLNSEQKEILSLNEASTYLSLSKSALYKLTSKKEIPFYRPTGKLIYFKRSELEEWITQHKVQSNNNAIGEVNDYLKRAIKTQKQ